MLALKTTNRRSQEVVPGLRNLPVAAGPPVGGSSLGVPGEAWRPGAGWRGCRIRRARRCASTALVVLTDGRTPPRPRMSASFVRYGDLWVITIGRT